MSDIASKTGGAKHPKLPCCNFLRADVKKTPKSDSNGASKAVLVPLEDLWDNGAELTYTFVKDSGNSVQHTKVKDVIKEWEKYANIKFKHVENPNDATIRISFTTEGKLSGDWSLLPGDIKENPYSKNIPGGEGEYENTMNLESVLAEGAVATEDERGTILHEFGHTLGLDHEHQSPVRVGVIDYKEDVVIEAYSKYLDMKEDEIRRQVLDVLKEGEYSNYTKLDTKSIMIYDIVAAFTIQGIGVEENTELSDMDKAFVQIHYPFFGGGNTQGISFTDALNKMDLEGENKEKLLQHFGNGKWKEIREDFRTMSIALRAQAAGK